MTDDRIGAAEGVDSVLVALADPTRRRLLELLAAHGEATATTL
ncbi:transcriptional regulator, partial [Streptomyces sp. NPDC054841]